MLFQSFVCDSKTWFCVSGGEGLAPPRLRRKTMVLRNVILVCALAENCVVGMGGLAPPLLRRKTRVLRRKPGGAILLCETADMPAV